MIFPSFLLPRRILRFHSPTNACAGDSQQQTETFVPLPFPPKGFPANEVGRVLDPFHQTRSRICWSKVRSLCGLFDLQFFMRTAKIRCQHILSVTPLGFIAPGDARPYSFTSDPPPQLLFACIQNWCPKIAAGRFGFPFCSNRAGLVMAGMHLARSAQAPLSFDANPSAENSIPARFG